MQRTRSRFRVRTAVALAGVVVAGVVAGCGSGPSGNATVSQVGGPAETSALYPGALLFPRAYPKPSVTLTDTAGNPYNVESATRDQLTLVYFGYTHCPDLCPLNMITTATAIGRLPKADQAKVNVVFITTDPLRDSPSVIRVWLDHFDTAFVGLTGSLAQIQQAESTTGVPLSVAGKVTEAGASYTVVHAGYVLAYTPDNESHLEFPAEITPSQEAQDLLTLLRQGWRA